MTSALAVEIDLYSGRPNPRWEMPPDDSAVFLSLMRTLPRTEGGRQPDALGYRGMIITPDGGTIAGYDRVVCYRGMVFAYQGDVVKTFLDQDRALEHWVAERIAPHAASDIRQFLTEEGL